MVNWGELVIATAVVVEKFERRIDVGAKKDRRRTRMSMSSCFVLVSAVERKNFFVVAASPGVVRRSPGGGGARGPGGLLGDGKTLSLSIVY